MRWAQLDVVFLEKVAVFKEKDSVLEMLDECYERNTIRKAHGSFGECIH